MGLKNTHQMLVFGAHGLRVQIKDGHSAHEAVCLGRALCEQLLVHIVCDVLHAVPGACKGLLCAITYT